MLSKIKNSIFIFFLIIVLNSCNEKNVLKFTKENLENCKKWDWIALSDTSLWTPKGDAYFTYVPNKITSEFRKLSKEEKLLCGTWQSIYTSSYFYTITESYKKQYESSNIFGNLYFCKDGIGYFKNTMFSKKINGYFKYTFIFNWKLESNIINIKPISINEEDIENNDIIETFEFSDDSYYKIGNINIDNKYLIQLSNWDFNMIPIKNTFIYKKYGIKNLGKDCLRYKYTWIEDWNEPILKNYIKEHPEYTLEELKQMDFYVIKEN